VIPFRPTPGSYNSVTASPGFIVRSGAEYLQFYSAATQDTNTRKVRRTIGIARTKTWTVPGRSTPSHRSLGRADRKHVALFREVESHLVSVYQSRRHRPRRRIHRCDLGLLEQGSESLEPGNKAVVLDTRNCKWTKHVIGLHRWCASRTGLPSFTWPRQGLVQPHGARYRPGLAAVTAGGSAIAMRTAICATAGSVFLDFDTPTRLKGAGFDRFHIFFETGPFV